jgi:hypothetical protein
MEKDIWKGIDGDKEREERERAVEWREKRIERREGEYGNSVFGNEKLITYLFRK